MDKIVSKLEALTETVGSDTPIVFSKVNIGSIENPTIYDGPIAEVYINDENNFQYTFSKTHIKRDLELIIGIYVKGLKETATVRVLDVKDLVIDMCETYPDLEDDLGVINNITLVENGQRAMGQHNNVKLFSAAIIHLNIQAFNAS